MVPALRAGGDFVPSRKRGAASPAVENQDLSSASRRLAANGAEPRRQAAPHGADLRWRYQSFSLPRRRATAWLCSWQTRDSLTSITAAISRKFMSCS